MTAITARPAPLEPGRLFTRDFAWLSLAVLVFFVAGGILIPVTPLFTREVLLGTFTDYPATFLVSAVIAAIGAIYLLLRSPVAGGQESAASPA